MGENVKDRVIQIIAEQAVLEPTDVSMEQSLNEIYGKKGS